MKENIETIEDIYIKYKAQIYAYLYYRTGNSAISEELCQEVFLKAFKAFSSFQGMSSVKTWLYSIAHNVYVSWYRRESKYEMIPLEKSQIEYFESLEGQPELAVEKMETSKSVMEVLNGLKEDFRNVLILSELQELSYEEIGNTLNWSLSKVKSTLYRARIQFRINFEKVGEKK
jgi:RNA polymerase sigma-70 factor (ECF subfamily)